MNKLLHKIISVALALTVLVSTLSFTVGKHYCMGQLVNMSFFGETSGCDMPIEEDDCKGAHKESKEKKEEGDCCFDVVDVVKSANSELKQETPFSVFTIKFVAAYIVTYSALFEVLQEKEVPNQEYSPPIITYDLQILHESFLI